jgi:hypothetical protein
VGPVTPAEPRTSDAGSLGGLRRPQERGLLCSTGVPALRGPEWKVSPSAAGAAELAAWPPVRRGLGCRYAGIPCLKRSCRAATQPSTMGSVVMRRACA